MLPRLKPQTKPEQLHQRFARRLRQAGFGGDIQLDFSSRMLQSTDNSIYQRIPQGVLYPADSEDLLRVAELSQLPEFHALTFSARGGGTGTNGQSLGEGFIVDLSRHMNKILEIDPKGRWARVQAGVVKDQLNAAVKPYGLFFAPDLSTSNRATIGGMISTDASGQGSCRYGKTRHHVLELETVMLGGIRWRSKPLRDAELVQLEKRGDRVGHIHRQLNRIQRENRATIDRIFPPLNRSLTGYDLAHLRDADQRFDLNSVLCGSEGSLGFVSEAVLNLEVLPTHSALVLLQYRDFVAALRDARSLMRAKPTAIETIDNIIVDLARGDAIWHEVQEFFPAQSSGELGAVNFVELAADSETELAQQLENFVGQLGQDDNPERLGYIHTQEARAIEKIWAMRKRAVGLLGNMAGDQRPIPFVEDTAVPPERLADYISEFRALLDARNLRYGMFGHADAGVIHVRPALDMRAATSMPLLREISDAVFALTQRYGGVLWGEHGKGLRSEYAPATFGELYPQMQAIKAAFDPHNQLNPGKIASPKPEQPLLRIDQVGTRGERDRLIAQTVWEQFPQAVHCNGNAACFNWDPDQVMCPSFKGSRERKFSPKGRASLLKEWLRQLGAAGRHPGRDPQTVENASGLQKLAAQTGKWLGQADFSHEVYEAMDTCLACKACATGCPVKVDVPAFRSVFFAHYFGRYLRPLRHHCIAQLEVLIPQLGSYPRLFNLAQLPPLAWLLNKALGLTAIPRLRTEAMEARLQALDLAIADPEQLRQLSAAEREASVILIPDVFTRYFETDLLVDVCRFLQRLGLKVWLAADSRNGKPLQVLGFLKEFDQVARATAEQLKELADTGVPLVGLEPSMTLTYRHEYRQTLPDFSTGVHLLQEWLASQAERLRAQAHQFKRGSYRLLPHCSEAALAAESLQAWQQVFALLGSDLRVEQLGCCGMAGTYGHESKHAATSKTIFDLSWRDKLAQWPEACATGFSCRAQVQRFSQQDLPHPLQLLLKD